MENNCGTWFLLGTAVITAGAVIIALVILFRETIGLGTVLNLLLIGTFLDLILWLDFFPRAGSFLPGSVLLVAGLFLLSLGSYFYISAGFDAGPRTALWSLLIGPSYRSEFAAVQWSSLPLSVAGGWVGWCALAPSFRPF